MIQKWISSILAGVFISMGAMVYLSIPNTLVGSLLFSTGIFLVLNLHNMLFTRVCPLMVYARQYNWSDMGIAWLGNGIGAFLAAWAVSLTRLGNTLGEAVADIGEIKLGDSPLSLFVLGYSALFLSRLPYSWARNKSRGHLDRSFMCGSLSRLLCSAGLSIS